MFPTFSRFHDESPRNNPAFLSFAVNRFGSKALKTKFRNYRPSARKHKRSTLLTFYRKLNTTEICTHTRVCLWVVFRGSDEFGETRKRCIIQRAKSRNFNKRKIRLATRSWDTRLSPARKYLRKILHSLSGTRRRWYVFLFYVFMSSQSRRKKRNSVRNKRTLMTFAERTAEKTRRNKTRKAYYSIIWTFFPGTPSISISLRGSSISVWRDFFQQKEIRFRKFHKVYMSKFLDSRDARSSVIVPEARGIPDMNPRLCSPAGHCRTEVLRLAHELTTCGRADSRHEWISRTIVPQDVPLGYPLSSRQEVANHLSWKSDFCSERGIFSHTLAYTIRPLPHGLSYLSNQELFNYGEIKIYFNNIESTRPRNGSLKLKKVTLQRRQNVDESTGTDWGDEERAESP